LASALIVLTGMSAASSRSPSPPHKRRRRSLSPLPLPVTPPWLPAQDVLDAGQATALAAALRVHNLVVAQRPAGCHCDYAVPVVGLSATNVNDIVVCDTCCPHCPRCGRAVAADYPDWGEVVETARDAADGTSYSVAHDVCWACHRAFVRQHGGRNDDIDDVSL
jgi:hypothetical protein